jgi:amidase
MSDRKDRDVSRRAIVAGTAAGLASMKAWAAPDPVPEAYLSLRVVARRIAVREVSPIDLTRRMLERVSRVDSVLKSYATVMRDQAMADAEKAASEIAAGRYRGTLHGMPIAIKDLCWTKGVRTMGGLAMRRNFVPHQDATVVARPRAAGAVVLGKTNLSEGAAAGYNPVMDVPLNPWNHDRWPGMSSSGSGVAAAAGLCFAAVGADTGGSIRNPASANGVVGLKPTYGRVSRYGVMPMAPSLDHVGAIAREVADAAILYDAMAGRGAADPTSLDAPPAEAFRALGGGVRSLKIGLDHAYALERTDRGQARAIEAALKVLEHQGAVITPVRMPDVSAVTPNWLTICSAEMAAAHAATYPSRASEYGPSTRDALAAWVVRRARRDDDWPFPSRSRPGDRITTRQYARLVDRWVAMIDLEPRAYGTHSLRRTKVALVYRKTGNLRARRLLLGHRKLESIVRYLGIEVDDALALSEQVEL